MLHTSFAITVYEQYLTSEIRSRIAYLIQTGNIIVLM